MELDANTTNNNVFKYAFIGAVLFSVAIGFTISNLSHIVMLNLSHVVVAGVLAVASLSMLVKAIKNDPVKIGKGNKMTSAV
jgi:hypothetical protein